MELEKTIVVTGHYGSGKTNLALNLALWLRGKGEEVALADLDIVNPYFRTSDFRDMAKRYGVTILASDYAGPGTNLDIPALSGALDARIGAAGRLIVDVGGDDAGAYALGRYAPEIVRRPYTMLYVVNAYRYLMKEPSDAAELLRMIEAASRLKATHIANCSNLGRETTAKDVLASAGYAERVAELTGRPLMLTAADRRFADALSTVRDLFPVDIYVAPPWAAD